VNRTKEVRLHPGQARVFNSDARFVAMICGSGSGKTFYGPIWLYSEIAKHRGEEWMVVAPSYKLLMDAAVKNLITFFEDTDAEGEFKRGDKIYHLPDGGRIYCRSADNPESIEAIHAKGLWFDEAGQAGRESWVVCQKRIAQKEGRMLITTTPYSENWLKTEIQDIARVLELDKDGNVINEEDGRDDYFVINFPSDINPYFSDKEFNRLKSTMTEKEFAMNYLGQFKRLEGLVYPGYRECVVEDDDYSPKMSDIRIGALDPGMSDPFGGITAIYGEDDKLHLKREMYKPNTLLRDVLELLDKETTYYADPAARREWEELSSLGADIEPADNAVKPGIMKVNEFIEDKRLVIPEDNFPNLISEFGGYAFKKNEDKPDPSTPHHLLDCLRYLIMGLADTTSLNIYAV
jgi:hypothetical protein